MFFAPQRFIPPEYRLQRELICGMDEVGRGCWAGPLLACALVLTKKISIRGLKDSKQLSSSRRQEIFEILHACSSYGIGMVESWEIDQMGLSRALKAAFQRAVDNLPLTPTYLLIDGRDRHELPHPYTTIIKGDEKVKVIACASIVAKVTRDRLMIEMAKRYPGYGFDEHKGYGTERHQQALRSLGITAIHRQSYRPLQKLKSQS